MAIRIVRLGSPRTKEEGPRLGTVRRPPRGVPRKDFARRDFYDVWFPLLAPSPEAMKLGLSAESDEEWSRFVRKFNAEMRAPAASQALDALAALSRQANFSVGCYCETESRCHRSLLRALLLARGATIRP